MLPDTYYASLNDTMSWQVASERSVCWYFGRDPVLRWEMFQITWKA